ncbi:FGGY-family carbohydrate kinase [Acidisoma cladoniae]|uniref:FGGY-family carbohydrate kinase n=1 Tax=Acidisoma cladoniae TaxID=3040935 RepID=UPI00255166D3|nr:FGGY-family carbohydrate kinase [Acidisoma sp. PAMC 29798]
MSLLLGIDFGTGGVRVGVFDLDRATMLGEAEATYATSYPRADWAEQSPTDWWAALGSACRRLMGELGHPDILGVAVGTTASTVVVCARDGTPLRPALLWMDCRAGVEAKQTARSRHPVFGGSEDGDASEWLIPKAMWLKTHEPDTYNRAAVICECLDYINFNLCDAWVASRMNATCKWNYDATAGTFPQDLYETFGIAEITDKIPTRVIPVGGAIAPITARAAAHLGLRTRPMVVQGGIDAHIGMIGAGTLDPGNMLMIGGTSVVHLFQIAPHRPLPGFWGPYPNALTNELSLVEGGQVSAGSVLSWMCDDVFGLDRAGRDALWRDAAAFPVGGTGLLTLDYLMGNRTPYRDPHLRGAIIGLALGHDRAALYRSAVEGLALASLHVLRRASSLGVEIHRVVASGGFLRNPLWLRATVDAMGLPLHIPAYQNLSILGAAGAAACGVGLVPDLYAAAAAVASPGAVIEPNAAAHAQYETLLSDYQEATVLLAPLMRRLVARRSDAAARATAPHDDSPAAPLILEEVRHG